MEPSGQARTCTPQCLLLPTCLLNKFFIKKERLRAGRHYGAQACSSVEADK